MGRQCSKTEWITGLDSVYENKEEGREEGRRRLGYAHLQRDGLADTEGRRKAVLYQPWRETLEALWVP